MARPELPLYPAVATPSLLCINVPPGYSPQEQSGLIAFMHRFTAIAGQPGSRPQRGMNLSGDRQFGTSRGA